jgi:hypothetical protein
MPSDRVVRIYRVPVLRVAKLAVATAPARAPAVVVVAVAVVT